MPMDFYLLRGSISIIVVSLKLSNGHVSTRVWPDKWRVCVCLFSHTPSAFRFHESLPCIREEEEKNVVVVVAITRQRNIVAISGCFFSFLYHIRRCQCHVFFKKTALFKKNIYTKTSSSYIAAIAIFVYLKENIY